MNPEGKSTTIDTDSRRLSLAVTWLVAIIALASFSVSFQGLNAVATWAGLQAPISWLVPVAVDAGLAVFAAAVLVRRGQGRSARLVWMLTAWLVLTSVAANAAHVLAPVDPSAWTPQLWAGATISASMPLVLFSSIEVISMIAFSRPAPLDETSVEDEIFEVSVVQDKMSPTVNSTPEVAPAPLPATTVVDVPEPKPVPAHSMTIPAAVSEPMPLPDALPAPIVERSAATATRKPTKPKPAARPAARSAKPVTTTAVRPMTDADLPEAIRMTEEGLSRQRVADALGVSKSAVTRALTAHEAKAAA